MKNPTEECRHNWLYVANPSGARPYWRCDVCLASTEDQPPCSATEDRNTIIEECAKHVELASLTYAGPDPSGISDLRYLIVASIRDLKNAAAPQVTVSREGSARSSRGPAVAAALGGKDYVAVPRRFLGDFIKAVRYGGHGQPTLDRAMCEVLLAEVNKLVEQEPVRSTTTRATIPLKVRPLLVSGMLALDAEGPVIVIDSEQDPKEQVIALWHEVLHLLGLTDEFLADEMAMALAGAAPDVLRRLAHNINVPGSGAPGDPA